MHMNVHTWPSRESWRLEIQIDHQSWIQAAMRTGRLNLREFVWLPSSWLPARAEGRSEQHLLTPLCLAPRAPLAPQAPFQSSTKKSFQSLLLHLRAFTLPKGICNFIGFQRLPSIIIGFVPELQPLSSTIIGLFSGILHVPQDAAKGSPRAPQREPKGANGTKQSS